MVQELPLFVFTMFAGLAAGAYIFAALFPLRTVEVPDGEDGKTGFVTRQWTLPLICLVLLVVSGLFLLTHLGHPERVLNAFSNPSAGITQEGVTMIAFGAFVAADLILCLVKDGAPRALRIVGAVLALSMTFAMGAAYVTSYGIPAWASWQTVPLFVLGDLGMGSALAVALGYGGDSKPMALACALVLYVLALVALVLAAFQLAPFGAAVPILATGVVLALVAAAAGAFRKKDAAAFAWVVFACLFVGVALVRFAFYAVA